MKKIEDIYRSAGLVSPATQMQNTFAGIDYRNKGVPVPINTDTMGLVFMTRPRLNMSYHNLIAFPEFTGWLSEDPYSMMNAIRCLLDPVGNNDRFRTAFLSRFNLPDNGDLPLLKSELVDPLNPFIPLITSNVLDLTGWQDRQMTPFVTEEGKRKESMSIPDGVYEINNVFDISMNLRSLPGDPITNLFNLWLMAMSQMRVGSSGSNFIRYIDDVLNKEQPYTTRIYRLVLDETKRYVRKFAANGWCYPTSVNEAGVFDFNRSLNQIEGEVKTVNFSCTAAYYNHPSIVKDFNRLVGMYNPNMRPVRYSEEDGELVGIANGTYKKLISDEEISYYNTTAYPRILLSTMELELYAPI